MSHKLKYMLKSITDAVDQLLTGNKRVVVAVDGRAASGKSTAAEYLAQKYNGCVVHADDFFLPFDMRSQERLAEPGGNIHYERLYDEVISRLRDGEEIKYGVFDCSIGEISGVKPINSDGVVIVEGAYSLHPKFGKYYDLAVFMTAERDVRLQRVASRSDEAKAKVFAERWMPLEEKYINVYNIQSSADIIISTDADENN